MMIYQKYDFNYCIQQDCYEESFVLLRSGKVRRIEASPSCRLSLVCKAGEAAD